MASSFRIRQQNFAEMQKNLDAVNSVLKSSIRLRGNYHSRQKNRNPLSLSLFLCLRIFFEKYMFVVVVVVFLLVFIS